jgi:hypothetical protein
LKGASHHIWLTEDVDRRLAAAVKGMGLTAKPKLTAV